MVNSKVIHGGFDKPNQEYFGSIMVQVQINANEHDENEFLAQAGVPL